MKILKTQVLRGPNIWSNYRNKLIQVRIDLEEMEKFPTDQIPGFAERLERDIPTLIEHTCSEGCRGGFYIRLKRGTWLGHVIEHVALEIQSLAGMETGYGRTRGTSVKGVYNMVFSFEIEQAGLYASEAAFRIVDAISKNQEYDIQAEIDHLKKLKIRYGLGPSTQSIVDEAERRGIPWQRIGDRSKIQLGSGKFQKQFQATMTKSTSAMAVNIASDKEDTKNLLAENGIPVARGSSCRDLERLNYIISKIGYPIVIKPLNGNHGKGVTVNINDEEAANAAFHFAKEFSSRVIVEKYVQGFDYRILVVDGKFVAASKRIPAHIIGDGNSTVKMLIDTINSDPNRGEAHESTLTKIALNDDTLAHLKRVGYNYESIPQKDENVVLKSTANLSTGGTAIDVTDYVHPANLLLAERAALIVGLDICGIDIMAPDLSTPITENGGIVMEVNAAPGFRMHLSPAEGKPRNVAKEVVDMLYPEGSKHSIPIFAITGTNGKTSTTRLLAHLVQSAGYTPGFTTTDGIYIGQHKIKTGDTTGPLSARMILRDPVADFAVLETARGGLLRGGLSFDKCDVGIVTNIQEDHLGINDINTLDDLANLKAVVARSVKENGYAVLNAEDEHCVRMAKEVNGNVVYFALDSQNEVIQTHISGGGLAVVVENNCVVIKNESETIVINHLGEIPLTQQGTAKFMVANVLAVTGAAFAFGFTVEQIQNALRTFLPTFEQMPGRMNLFEFKEFKVLVDYAHNPHGLLAMKDYLSHITCERKVGMIAGIGDRREEDIIEVGKIAATMFDHIVVRQEHGLRGRTVDEINNLIVKGIESSGREVKYDLFSNERDAVNHLLSIAQPGDFIVALSDEYQIAIEAITQKQKNECENSI